MLDSKPPSKDDRLKRDRNIWLATVRPDGRPHLVPVWFVWNGEKLFVCIDPSSVKARNLMGNSKASLALEDGTHPIICEGEARTVSQPWPEKVVSDFRNKYDWDITEETTYTQLIEIHPLKWLRW